MKLEIEYPDELDLDRVIDEIANVFSFLEKEMITDQGKYRIRVVRIIIEEVEIDK